MSEAANATASAAAAATTAASTNETFLGFVKDTVSSGWHFITTVFSWLWDAFFFLAYYFLWGAIAVATVGAVIMGFSFIVFVVCMGAVSLAECAGLKARTTAGSGSTSEGTSEAQRGDAGSAAAAAAEEGDGMELDAMEAMLDEMQRQYEENYSEGGVIFDAEASAAAVAAAV